MSDPWRSLKIKQFEQVTAGPSVALMRITGKASWRGEATPDQRPTLVADDGREVARFTPLSSPPDDRGVLRAAYSVPERLITAETVFSLELKDGHVIALPAPASRAGSRAAATPPPDVTTPPPPAPAPAADEALRRELADANRRAEEALLEAAAAHDQREELEQRNADLAESLRERQAALDELEVWCGELERRLASMSSELGDATARLRAAEEELEELRPEPAAGVDPPEGLEDLRRRAAAEAGEVAARELAEAAAERHGPGL